VIVSADPFWLTAWDETEPLNGRGGWAYARFLRRSALPGRLKARLLLRDARQRFRLWWHERLGLSIFRRGLSLLRHGGAFGLRPAAEVLVSGASDGILRDGRQVQRGQDAVRPDLAAAARVTRGQLASPADSYYRYSLSPSRRDLFVAWIRDMAAQGTAVWVVATPEDDVTRAWRQAHQAAAYADYAALVGALKKEGSVRYARLDWDRRTCGCGEEEFSDGSHGNLDCIGRLEARVLAETAGLR
jgi:hypothetical protein